MCPFISMIILFMHFTLIRYIQMWKFDKMITMVYSYHAMTIYCPDR